MSLFDLIRKPAEAEPATASLDKPDLNAMLLEMQKYGETWLHSTEKGTWRCSVDMRMAAKGTKFECGSTFKCASPLDAVNECNDRIKEALKMIGGGAP